MKRISDPLATAPRPVDLFSLPPSNGTRTSNAAADSIAPSAATLRSRLYQWLLDRGEEGATDEEMQLGIPMAPSTQRPRRGELSRDGLVLDRGDTRPTNSGRQATVWVAVRNGGGA
jgi:hypothetical protein